MGLGTRSVNNTAFIKVLATAGSKSENHAIQSTSSRI